MNRLYTMQPAIRPVTDSDLRVLGPACTVKVYPGDNLMVHKALDVAQPGDVIVIDAGQSMMNGVLGDLISTKARHRGVQGYVVDGLIRDLPDIQALRDFPVFARASAPSGRCTAGPARSITPSAPGHRRQARRRHRGRPQRRRPCRARSRTSSSSACATAPPWRRDYTAAVRRGDFDNTCGSTRCCTATASRRATRSLPSRRDARRQHGAGHQPAFRTEPARDPAGRECQRRVRRALPGRGGRSRHGSGPQREPVRHSRACACFVDLGRGDGVQACWLRWFAGAPARAVLLPCDDDAPSCSSRTGRP